MSHGPAPGRRALLRGASAMVVALALLASRAGAVVPDRGAEPDGFTLVVHASNASTALTADQVSRMFLRKLRTWPGGEQVMPVEPTDKSPARKAFSKQVLGKDVAAMRGYWQQMIFTGKGVPPLEKASEAEVLAYVAATPGAIGYVSAGVELPAGVKAVTLAR